MQKNTIQFQKGLSLHDFIEKFGTDEQCSQALYKLRWPTGYVCPSCGNTTGCALKSRKLYQCHKCHHQTSLTAGTIFYGTKLPLKKWFLACYLLTQRKKSISALQLSREIGVNYDTAWKLKHKLMQVMLERQQKKQLQGRIEMDDAYLGGEKAGKRGRGSRNKIPFVAAVETTQDGRPLWIQLRRVRGFRKVEIARYVQSSLSDHCTVFTDGLHCFRAVQEVGATTFLLSRVVDEKVLNFPISNGLTPFLVTSRMHCREPFMLYVKNMRLVIWLNSNIDLTDALICRP